MDVKCVCCQKTFIFELDNKAIAIDTKGITETNETFFFYACGECSKYIPGANEPRTRDNLDDTHNK